VWQALRAACYEEDPNQVQAILDAARVTVPSNVAVELTGNMNGGSNGEGGSGSRRGRRQNRSQRPDPMAQLACYDHLGNLYIIPLKILSDPSNLTEDSGGSGDGGGGSGSGGSYQDTVLSKPQQQQQHQSTLTGKAVARRDHKENVVVPEQEIARIRLSNSQKEVSLPVVGTQTIGQIKARLVENRLVREKSPVRVFFLGRVLDDRERLQDISYFHLGPQGTVLQVLVSEV